MLLANKQESIFIEQKLRLQIRTTLQYKYKVMQKNGWINLSTRFCQVSLKLA